MDLFLIGFITYGFVVKPSLFRGIFGSAPCHMERILHVQDFNGTSAKEANMGVSLFRGPSKPVVFLLFFL